MLSNRQPLGRAWLEDGWRNFYEMREIRRGRQKGSFELVYIIGPDKTRKRVVPVNVIRFHDPLEV